MWVKLFSDAYFIMLFSMFVMINLLLLQAAFDILGFTQPEKDNVYKVTAAVMHMGELKFKQRGSAI